MPTGSGALRAALGVGVSLAALVVLGLSGTQPDQGKREPAEAKMRQLHNRVQDLLTYGATSIGKTGTETGNLGRFWNYGRDFDGGKSH